MMADSEGEENTMRTNQPDMVRQSLEATAHPDVYARRKVATRRATEVVIDLGAPVAPEEDDCPVHGAGVTVASEAEARALYDRPIAHDGQGGIRYMTIDEMRDAGHSLPDSADTLLQGYEGMGPRRAAEQREQRMASHDRYMANLGRRREGWRGRLAHIEMLLARAHEEDAYLLPVEQALAEVRAMIDEA